MSTKQIRYTALFKPSEDGGYTVHFPVLPGCITEGDTIEEARANATEALQAYLESLVADGLPLPEDRPWPVVQEEVAIELQGA